MQASLGECLGERWPLLTPAELQPVSSLGKQRHRSKQVMEWANHESRTACGTEAGCCHGGAAASLVWLDWLRRQHDEMHVGMSAV
jgi:hypothetical protein